ncbi:hypothetical protein LX32DRAFT_652233 [Colletotrichum zoysiae]|uniref:Uncharacterized protein n=1 Tax=Colletotrichum zoysiae TaxID=1216348 RepID=A0AAD9HK90_9PEZI|nr:hypothetical protein LX32DRAFT_652233 [Colletotrichum zoysiae]
MATGKQYGHQRDVRQVRPSSSGSNPLRTVWRETYEVWDGVCYGVGKAYFKITGKLHARWERPVWTDSMDAKIGIDGLLPTDDVGREISIHRAREESQVVCGFTGGGGGASPST